MNKILYYIRTILFTIYLILVFLLIDKIFNINIFATIYFIINLIYSFIMILTIISKKDIFIHNPSYNILNIGIYLYTGMIYYFVHISSKLDILNNKIYYRNNFIFLIFLLVSIIIYTFLLNKEKK